MVDVISPGLTCTLLSPWMIRNWSTCYAEAGELRSKSHGQRVLREQTPHKRHRKCALTTAIFLGLVRQHLCGGKVKLLLDKSPASSLERIGAVHAIGHKSGRNHRKQSHGVYRAAHTLGADRIGEVGHLCISSP